MAGRRALWLLFLFLAAAAVGFCRATRDPFPAQQGVAVPAGEELETARVVASTVALVDRSRPEGRPFARSMFAKGHACVRATVDVPELEPRLRHGLFGRPARYQAWIRFANGSERVGSDQHRDRHGLALKVMGVPGEKLLEGEREADTQDFLLSDSPRFPVASVHEYAELADSMARGERLGYLLNGSLLPWRWRVRSSWLLVSARSAPPRSLLQTQYYSGTAYRLGREQYVKYGARPCQRNGSPRRDRTDDVLRRRLEEELANGDACLELTLQLQILGKNMPIEDPTVLWREEDSPFLPVARITVPRQVFDTPEQDRFCDDLSFTPWHSLPEHEPVGGLNRLRKAVYTEVSRYRHARNGTPRAEPRGYCLDLTGASCPVAAASAPPVEATPAAASAVSVPPRTKPAPGGAVSAPAPASPTPEAAPTPTPTATPTPIPTREPEPVPALAPETQPAAPPGR